jgi:hypothetical protein
MFEITEGEDEYDLEQVYSKAELHIAPPDLEEVREVIYSINNEVLGIDMIPIELIKEGWVNLHIRLHTLITRVWEKEEVPADKKLAIFCPIHKKGDKTYCRNYGGIMLLGVVYKVLSKIVSKRLEPYMEEITGDYQAGFRKNKSTSGQILAMKHILEKCYEYDVDIHCIFVDLNKHMAVFAGMNCTKSCMK